MTDTLYKTRIYEHLNRTSEHLKAHNKSAMTIVDLSIGAGVPYQTLRWYMNASIANPNYSVVDRVRRYLNNYYEMGSEDYIYPINGQSNEAAS